jgi:hypothetical protein
MKRLSNFYPLLFSLCLQLPVCFTANGQDSSRKNLLVDLGYHSLNNTVVFLSVNAKTKEKGKFQPVGGARIRLFLDKDSTACIAGDAVTDSKGSARVFLPPSLKNQWNSAATHTFIAVSDGDSAFNPSRTENSVVKAHLEIDTGQGQTILAKIVELKNNVWVPVKAVEIKVAIKRSGSDLAVSDKDSYTTDSTGTISAEFQRAGIPGDKNGLLTLVAKVEDNDTYGNLRVEKSEPWGAVLKLTDTFDKRSLWAARFKTPIWLLLMEYSIFLSVWAVVIYLAFQIRKIIKAGRLV